jgi:hypothetical protein
MPTYMYYMQKIMYNMQGFYIMHIMHIAKYAKHVTIQQLHIKQLLNV